MAFANDLYIDEIYIDTSGGDPFDVDSSETFLAGITDLDGGIDNTIGYKWIMQVTNKTTNILDLSDYSLDINVGYFDNLGAVQTTTETVSLGTNDLDIGESIYIGWDGITNITPDITLEKYLLDQILDTGGSKLLLVTTKLDLKDNLSTTIDDVGTLNAQTTTTYDQSIILDAIHREEQDYITDFSYTNSPGDGSYYRNTTSSTIPNSTWATGDWLYSASIGDNYLNLPNATFVGNYLFDATDYDSSNGTIIVDNKTYSGNGNDLDLSGGGNWSTANPFSPSTSVYSYNCNNSGFWRKQLGAVTSAMSFSVCVWFNTNGDNAPGDYDSIFSNYEGSGGGFQINCKEQLVDRRWTVLKADSAGNKWVIANYQDNSNWHHIAITYDPSVSSGTLKTYYDYDGTQNTYTSVSNTISNFQWIKLGVDRENDNPFNGSISSSRVYFNRVLTDTEINNIYSYNSIEGSGGAVGDPHITTLNDITYDFNYLGFFRLFDNREENIEDRLIINCLSENGVGRWNKNQYIKLVYVFKGGKEILIDTGFRGVEAKVLNNTGIEYIDVDLDLDKEARNYCYSCKKSFKKGDKKAEAHNLFEEHKVLKMVRNKIIIIIKIKNQEYLLNIENVNKYNLQPCRVFLRPLTKINKKWGGCLMDRKHTINNKLEMLEDKTIIEDPTNYNFKDLPKIIKHPSQKNKKYE